MARTDTSIEVSRTIDAPAKDIFAILSNPERHAEVDATDTVVSDHKTNRIQAVGDVFTMNMNAELMGGDYQTDNHVVGFVENKLISWKTAPAGEEPMGWSWTYRLDAQDADTTEVTLTYDWSAVTDKKMLGSLPAFDEAALESSLGNLAAAVSS